MSPSSDAPWVNYFNNNVKSPNEKLQKSEITIMAKMQQALKRKLTEEEQHSKFDTPTKPTQEATSTSPKPKEPVIPFVPVGNGKRIIPQQEEEYEKKLIKRMEEIKNKKLSPEQQAKFESIHVSPNKENRKSETNHPTTAILPWRPTSPGKTPRSEWQAKVERLIEKQMVKAKEKKLTSDEQHKFDDLLKNSPKIDKVPKPPAEGAPVAQWLPCGTKRVPRTDGVEKLERDLAKRMIEAMQKKLSPTELARFHPPPKTPSPPKKNAEENTSPAFWKPASPNSRSPRTESQEKFEKAIEKRMMEMNNKKLNQSEMEKWTAYPPVAQRIKVSTETYLAEPWHLNYKKAAPSDSILKMEKLISKRMEDIKARKLTQHEQESKWGKKSIALPNSSSLNTSI